MSTGALIVALAVVLPLLAAACESPERRIGDTVYRERATEDVRGQASVEIEAENLYFSPTFLRGEPGQVIAITVRNADQREHSFTVEAHGIDVEFGAGGEARVEVRFPEQGALQFYCRFHTTQGMNGQLLTGEATPQAVSR